MQPCTESVGVGRFQTVFHSSRDARNSIEKGGEVSDEKSERKNIKMYMTLSLGSIYYLNILSKHILPSI